MRTRLSLFRLAVFCGVLVILALSINTRRITFSQSSSCPTTKTPRWSAGTTVYYDYGNITNPAIKAQIKAAADKWTAANANNGSGVSFVEGPPPQGATGYSSATFQTGTVSGGIAHTSYSCQSCNKHEFRNRNI
jgi:hypothetical protein